MPRKKTEPTTIVSSSAPAVDSLNIPDQARVKKTADYLEMTVSYLRSEIAAGNITPVKFGKRFVFFKEEILRYRSQVAQDHGVMSAVR